MTNVVRLPTKPWRVIVTVILVPARNTRSNPRARVRFFLRTAGDHEPRGHAPLQRTRIFALRGARMDSSVTRAPAGVRCPRMRTTGNGFMARSELAESCRTWPIVGTGVAAGTGMSKVGAGVGSGVVTGAGVALGVAAGVTTGVGVGGGGLATRAVGELMRKRVVKVS